MSIALHILDVVIERAEGARIKRVTIEVGVLSGVLPDALRFAFELAREDTAASGALLEIIEAKGLADCRSCGERVELARAFDACACGGIDLAWVSGEQLLIRDMEVVEACA